MVQVVVGVIPNAKKEILVTQRPTQKSYSGYWEFPGGKKEPNETAYQALVRELKEELDLEILSAEPWKKLDYAYPEKLVELDLWIVTEFRREPRGMENQAFQWVALDQLAAIDFLPANKMVLAEVALRFA
jgi:8-oxo-dGTP diphosphatase